MDDLIILISLIVLELSDAHDKQILNSLLLQSRSGLLWIISPGTLYIQLTFLEQRLRVPVVQSPSGAVGTSAYILADKRRA